MKNVKKIVFLIGVICVIVLAIFISMNLLTKSKNKKILSNFEQKLEEIGDSKNLSFSDGEDLRCYYTEKAVVYKDKEGKITSYSNEEERLVIDNDNKTATLCTNDSKFDIGKPAIYLNFGYLADVLNEDKDVNIEDINIMDEYKLKDVAKISDGEYKGQKCYILDIMREKFYIDKDTYMPIAMVESSNNQTTEYNIKLDDVSDSDVVYPDLTDYNITELESQV